MASHIPQSYFIPTEEEEEEPQDQTETAKRAAELLQQALQELLQQTSTTPRAYRPAKGRSTRPTYKQTVNMSTRTSHPSQAECSAAGSRRKPRKPPQPSPPLTLSVEVSTQQTLAAPLPTKPPRRKGLAKVPIHTGYYNPAVEEQKRREERKAQNQHQPAQPTNTPTPTPTAAGASTSRVTPISRPKMKAYKKKKKQQTPTQADTNRTSTPTPSVPPSVEVNQEQEHHPTSPINNLSQSTRERPSEQDQHQHSLNTPPPVFTSRRGTHTARPKQKAYKNKPAIRREDPVDHPTTPAPNTRLAQRTQAQHQEENHRRRNQSQTAQTNPRNPLGVYTDSILSPLPERVSPTTRARQEQEVSDFMTHYGICNLGHYAIDVPNHKPYTPRFANERTEEWWDAEEFLRELQEATEPARRYEDPDPTNSQQPPTTQRTTQEQ
ncbi:hypothetical protein KC19_11G142500 [Ceratodon purpureus]|uniref:Uncharacterized protein n=1 Tax=Ceratodon purpureus TaxID=3225 RepID=A0A8T0GDV4_CERPU|nr:hypothetical protein KC19_11G142500 [Ceratodon purpureus]